MGDREIDAQEDENITHTAVVSQEPLPGTTNRIKIPAHIMNQRVFSILLTIPGVDAQPDTIDKGPYGPWFYLTEKYAAEHLTLFAINNFMHYTDPNSGITVNITIKARKILEDKVNPATPPLAPTPSPARSSRPLYSTL
jgi:hypothetical protein